MQRFEIEVAPADRGKRLDAFLHERLPEYSRSRLQTWIRESRVRVNGKAEKPSFVLRGEESIGIETLDLPPLRATAEAIPLQVLYEDTACVAIDKPAGMVVHAGAGVHSGTVVNALLNRFQSLSEVGGDLRPGIVHRIDRFTSGVLLVAKTDKAHLFLAEQFASRTVTKVYLALVEGRLEGRGRITKPISRDPKNRARMTARGSSGRTALTDWEVLEQFQTHTLLRIRIGTGRTHQIRAHMSSIGHAVAGDPLYGGRPSIYGRFFLHAHSLTFVRPETRDDVTVVSPLPQELESWLASLRSLRND